jgi:hypothetical protein
MTMSEPAWKYLDDAGRREAAAALAEYEREEAAWKASKPPSGAAKLVQELTRSLDLLLRASGLPSGGMDVRVQLPAEAYSLIEREVEWMTRRVVGGEVRPPCADGVTIITAIGTVHFAEAKP